MKGEQFALADILLNRNLRINKVACIFLLVHKTFLAVEISIFNGAKLCENPLKSSKNGEIRLENTIKDKIIFVSSDFCLPNVFYYAKIT